MLIALGNFVQIPDQILQEFFKSINPLTNITMDNWLIAEYQLV